MPPNRSWSDRGVARRTGPETPLGHWLEARIPAAGFRSKDAFRTELRVTNSTFNDWQRGDVASVPERTQVAKMVALLKLNREQKAELEEVLVAQEEARKEAQSREPVRASDVAVSQVQPDGSGNAERTVEIRTSYTHLPLALKLMAKVRRYEPVLDALPLWRGKDEDPTVEGWFKIGDELLATLRDHGAEGIGDEDAGLGGGKLEALKKKGKKR
jgi:hypothetical protein